MHINSPIVQGQLKENNQTDKFNSLEKIPKKGWKMKK